MKNPNLLTRSSYTFFNSILKIQDIINLTINNNFSNAFLIDKNVMYGAYEFYELCKKNNIKPIIGLQIETKEINTIFLAKNYDGYIELTKISSYLKTNMEFNIEKINKENIIEFKENIIPVLYKNFDDIDSLKIFNSIASSKEKFLGTSSHFLSREEFLIVNGKEKLNKIDSLINEIDLIIPKKEIILPEFKINHEVINGEKFLKDLLAEKLKKFLLKNLSYKKSDYFKRVEYELSIIIKMKFENYFLIVYDIVNWAKSQNILVGPGRGSAPGSLISFLLGITSIDPIENDLLFERFLNPERITMPDIDIDFEDTKREEVINYIAKKYGKNNVAQIITFQTLKARMSFKDVARIKGLSANEANEISKLIDENKTLDEAIENKNLKIKIDSSELLTEIYEIAKKIEGLPRQFSTHAAGIIISKENLYSLLPIQIGNNNFLQTQYSMDFMEKNGLLKIDLLGLTNLSFLKEILQKVNFEKNVKIDLDKIPLNDKNVFEYLSQGKTLGIFQLESFGMRKSLKKIKITCFEDIVVVISLYRPGPIKMIDEYAKRKNGLISFDYLNNQMKEVLKSTYGIIIYQEQILKIVQIVSNFSLAKADIFRRAIGKKDNKLLISLKKDFINGAIKNSYEKNDANKIYETIFKFSNYGFNRSHAYSYAKFSYWLTWLKINYPLEFMTSSLNFVIGNSKKTSDYVNECIENKIKINEPSIFISKSEHIIKNDEIFIGFKAIKGIGDSFIKIVSKLQDKIHPKMSIIDFFINAYILGVTTKMLEILIKSNSLREFNYNQETLLINLENVENYFKMIKVVDSNKKISYDKEIIEEPIMKIIDSKKNYFFELTGFSIDFDKNEISNSLKRAISTFSLEKIDWNNLVDGQQIEFVGEIIILTKKSLEMAFAKINTEDSKINVIFWPNLFLKYRNNIKIGAIMIFTCKFNNQKNEYIIEKLREI